MSQDPLYIRILEKLGVNTTRLKWKLYQKEKQIQDAARGGIKPKGFQWLSYPHKICSHCHAINDKESRECSSCNRRLPNMFIYKITRLLASSGPSDRPLVIQGFLGLMFLFFAIQVSAGGFEMGNIMMPNHVGTVILGAFTADIFTSPFHLFRWFAFGLLHGGLIHIGFNSYALYQIGPIIESQIGRARMLVLITITQFGAAFACYLWYFKIQHINTSVIGASGWVFGLIGFGIVMFHKMGIEAARNSLLKWTAFMLIFGMVVGGISNAAHIGGLLSGMGLAMLPMGGNQRKPGIDKAWNIGSIISILIWLITIIMMFISLSILGPEHL
jgi:rhomboid protease GluP